MLRMNQRNTSTEKVSIDTLLPSSNFILRGQITSPTMARGSTPYSFDEGELEVCVFVQFISVGLNFFMFPQFL